MGREIRRVPANWQHPTYRTMRLRPGFYGEIETWKPLLARDFADEAAAWDAESAAWALGQRPDGFDVNSYGDMSFVDWHGERPDADWYVPYDVNGDLPWWQAYETVSEGTPVTPAFATPEELIQHLATVGMTYEEGETDGPWGETRARAFVLKEGWFPSAVFSDGECYDAKTGWPE